MAWSNRTSGTESVGNNGTSLAPGLPASFAANDLHIVEVQTYGGTNGRVPSIASGWNVLGSWANGTSRHYFAWRKAVAGDTAPTITMTGTGATNDTQVSRVHGFRSSLGDFALDQTGTTSTNASADDVGPITGITPTTGALAVLTAGKSNDWNGTATLASWLLAAQTESTTGTDASTALLYVLNWGGGATGNLTVTDNGGTASAGVGQGQMASFVEVVGAQNLTATGQAHTDLFGTAVVTRGAVAVSVASVVNASTYGAPTVTRGAVTLTATGLAGSAALGAPTVELAPSAPFFISAASAI